MNVKKNRAQLLVKKQTTFFNDADGPVSVSEWEARGTNFNARTYHFQRFIQYLGTDIPSALWYNTGIYHYTVLHGILWFKR